MKWILFVFVCVSLMGCQQGMFKVSVEQEYSLELTSIGIANPDKPLDARKVNELKFFEGRLYVGQGDISINTGPTDIICYDPATETFHKEFTVDDEAIKKYCIVDGQLMVPGSDATEEWGWENYYIKNPDGWQKHRKLLDGGHAFDMVSYKGNLYIGTMLWMKRSDKYYVAPGGVFKSEDDGQTCELVWMSPCDAMAWNNCDSLVVFRDKLYVFSYSYSGYKDINKFPEQYRSFQTVRFAGMYLFYIWDFCGPSDVAVYDSETGWTMEDLISDPDVCRVEGFVFRDKLVMAALLGKYITFSPYAENAERALYVYDGQKTTKANIAYDALLDVLVKADQLFLLVYRNDRYEILETNDLKHLNVYVLPDIESQPMSIEYDGQVFYIGASDGNIYRSAVSTFSTQAN